DAIVLLDPENHRIVGYKDVRADEFWVRGHMPGMPLLPGVLMCEAAAQLCSYYIMTQGLMGEGNIVGFGGLENVRFRAAVRPVEVEVGFGKGAFLVDAGLAHPGTNYLGIEVVRKLQLYVATRLAKRNLRNVRVACTDARLFFRDRVSTGSLEAVHVYFPDPW